MGEILQLENLSFTYLNGNQVFDQVDLSIGAGEFILVKGVSGTGKSTLLRLLCRLEEPTDGQILLEGVPIDQFEPTLLRRRIYYFQQTPTLIDGSILDNLLLPFSFKANASLERPEIDQLEAQLKHFYLKEVKLTQPASALSIGQKQRLCLIRALLLRPDVFLLDEPTSALDEDNADLIFKMVHDLNQIENMTIVLVTHQKIDKYEFKNLKPIEVSQKKVRFK